MFSLFFSFVRQIWHACRLLIERVQSVSSSMTVLNSPPPCEWSINPHRGSVNRCSYKYFPLAHPLVPPPQKKKNLEVQRDRSFPRLSNIDQGEGRGHTVAVLNPRNWRPVGDKMQNSLHFLSKSGVLAYTFSNLND